MELTLSSCSSHHHPHKPAASTIVEQLKKHSLVPPQWKDSVRVVGLSEYREAALTLAHAFAADDYARYLVDPGLSAPEEKWKLHVDIMAYVVAAHCISGLATTIGPGCDSVALWLQPGKDLDGWWTLLRSGLWRLNFQLSAEGRRRYFDEILPLLHDTKAAVLGERDHDAWYLVYLGTKPDSQGRGYAGKLLREVMRRADADCQPIYLESSALANNAYYQKFGFEVRRDIFLERGPAPVRLSIMVREPLSHQQQQQQQQAPRGKVVDGDDGDDDTTAVVTTTTTPTPPSSPISVASSAPSSADTLATLSSSTSSTTDSLPSSLAEGSKEDDDDDMAMGMEMLVGERG